MAIYQNKVRPLKPLGKWRSIVEQPLERQTHHATIVREAEGHCTTTITEAEACCAADIREAESHSADHACATQQSHIDNIQHLEREAIQEEGKNCQSFLAACGMALQICPLEAWGILMCLLQLLMGNMSLAILLAISPWTPTAREESNP